MATDGRARVGRTPSVEVEETLLRAGGALLAEHGLGGLTLRAVTAAAGVAPSGVYSRFGGMDGLVDGLLVRAFADLASACDTRQITGPHDRLAACASAYRSWALANPRLYEAMFMARPGYGSPAVATAVRQAITVLVGQVEYAMAAGAIAPQPALEVAQQMLNAAHGAVSLELKDLVLTDDTEGAYMAMVATLLRGLRPR